MSTLPLQHLNDDPAWQLPSRGKFGMASFIVAETAMFAIFVVAYIYYIGRDVYGPKPHEVLKTPIFGTVCLLSSSYFVWLAERAIHRGRMIAFRSWLALTTILGAVFLVDTGLEWHKLITQDHLTVSTNLFGTTFYSLVGLHASHVTMGLLLLSILLVAALRNKVTPAHARHVQVLSLYWHFVDAVWVVVFAVVYIVSAR